MQRSFWVAAVLVVLLVGLPFGCGGRPGEREFRNGVKEIDRGNYVRGITLLEKSITKRPGSDDNAIAYNLLGVACWKLGQVQRATEAFEYSRRLAPALFEPTYNLASLLFDGGDIERAATLLEEAAVLDTQDPRALELLGQIHAQKGEWQEARRVLFGAFARSPKSPRVLTALGVIESRTGGADKAIFYLTQALDKNPSYAPAIFNLAVLYQREVKDKEQAVTYYRRFLEAPGLDPDHVEQAMQALEELGAGQPKPTPAPEPVPAQPAAPSAPVAAVVTPAPQPAAPAARPPAEPAVRTAETLLKEAADEAGRGKAQAALNLCLEAAARAERSKDEALQEKALREAVRLCFDQARAHYALGRFLFGRGDVEAASKAYKQAMVLDPKFALAYIGLAESAVKTGEMDAALVAIKQATQLEPNNPDVWWTQATLYEQLKLTEKAVQAYRDFEKRFPGDARVLKAGERVRKLEPPLAPAPVVAPPRAAVPANSTAPAAIPPVTQISAPPRAPASASGRKLSIRKPLFRNTSAAVEAYNRGVVYQQREDWDRAIYYYTRAVENDDAFATAFFNLGAVYWSRGDLDLARDAYAHAVELRPDMVAARYNLALVLRERKERAAALDQFNALLKLNPGYAPAHYALGMIYAEDAGTLAQARRHYQEFLKLAPADPSAPTVKGWLETH